MKRNVQLMEETKDGVEALKNTVKDVRVNNNLSCHIGNTSSSKSQCKHTIRHLQITQILRFCMPVCYQHKLFHLDVCLRSRGVNKEEKSCFAYLTQLVKQYSLNVLYSLETLWYYIYPYGITYIHMEGLRKNE